MSDALRAQVDADLQDIDKVIAGSRETREKLDQTLRAYANLERSCAAKARRIAQLERAIQLAFNHAEKWSAKGMQDHLWRSLKEKGNDA